MSYLLGPHEQGMLYGVGPIEGSVTQKQKMHWNQELTRTLTCQAYHRHLRSSQR